ncbi:putative protein kinase RLK-Pelle-LRR-XII-1 family [Rosa chinensis]|uniref:Protein kinase domain-containing protein n=1 Tax=Rosa chinensis TaxID=74649 RepID=A0A2P6PJY4_ROSCH|nr:putative protein kinase RLK-Pelle-LRR-XII-1 family [Rosa chinensis]
MPNLQIMFLAGNEFSGQIPASLSNASQLLGLDFAGNNFVGQLPASFGNFLISRCSTSSSSNDLGFITFLTNYSKLEVYHTSFFWEVTKLQRLYLNSNRLSGRIPSSLGNLTQLFELRLSENELEESIPPKIGNCKNLQLMDISHNKLSGDIPSQVIGLSSFSILLNLSQNSLTGILPVEVGKLKNINTLDISDINLTRGIPEIIGGCLSLEFLDLQGNHFPRIIPSSLATLRVVLALYWRRKTQKTKPLIAVSSINFLPKVSCQTLHHATGGFSSSNQIGSGGFGSVYKRILNQEESNVVAIKVLNLQQKGASKSFVAKCNALRNIRNMNLVKNLTCCSSTDYNGNDFKTLVFEYMSNGSLEEWLHRENQSRGLNLLQRLNIAIDLASALCYLHDYCEPQITHCDMKPSNVLLDDDMVARVGDFGSARLISTTTDSSQNQSSTIGIKETIVYAAPEDASGVEPSRQGDVYSYGVLVLQMFTGRRPIDEMFKEGLNLHNFVKMAIPGRVMQIVDPTLLATLEDTTPATSQNVVNYINGYNNEIEAVEENIDNENLSKMNTYVWKCILPTLKIGLACSEESP